MNPIDWLFKILLRYVPVDETEFARMKNEAVEWYAGIDHTDPKTNELSAKFKKIFLDWRGKLVLAILFIPACRWVNNLVNPTIEDEDDDV
jgi:hypothetical protein